MPALDTEDFFADLEKRLGEKIRIYSLARCVSGCGGARLPIWGLCFVTERAFHFHYHVQGRSLVGLVLGGAPQEERIVSVPLDAIQEVRRPPRPSFLRRIVAMPLPALIVTYLDKQGSSKELHVELDPNPKRPADIGQFEQAIAAPGD